MAQAGAGGSGAAGGRSPEPSSGVLVGGSPPEDAPPGAEAAGRRDFLILDAAMNDLLRPAMYGAHHDIVPVIEPVPGAEPMLYDVVGPVCESGDTFARARPMPRLEPGALVAFRSAGAYGAVMASEYNARPLVPEVLVSGDRWAVVRPRPTVEEMLARERLPDWLGAVAPQRA